MEWPMKLTYQNGINVYDKTIKLKKMSERLFEQLTSQYNDFNWNYFNHPRINIRFQHTMMGSNLKLLSNLWDSETQMT